jgi:ElaB/YqjD/DUF883 family membrane-anchored ribosome-binding protein
MSATIAETRANAREIEKLRERSHEYGNLLQELKVLVAGVDQKLDATHTSVKGRIAELRAEVKEDLTEIKAQTTETNGRVGGHDRQISRLQGGLAVVALSLPALTTLGFFVLERL